jgi:hypothetical protein
MILTLSHLNITVSDKVQVGDEIIIYRATQLIGHGKLEGMTEDEVSLQLYREASNAYSEMTGKELPYKFEVRER